MNGIRCKGGKYKAYQPQVAWQGQQIQRHRPNTDKANKRKRRQGIGRGHEAPHGWPPFTMIAKKHLQQTTCT